MALAPSAAALEMTGPAAVSHVCWLVLVGVPTLGEVLRLLLLETGARERDGRMFAQMKAWLDDCLMASVGEGRIRIQLARALWALHTGDPRDDPDFTNVPVRARRRSR